MTDETPKPAPSAWTKEEDESLLTLRSENLTAHQIAEQLGTGRTVNAIHSRYAALNRQSNQWSNEDLATITRMHGEGADLASILQALPGRNRSSISAKLRHMTAHNAARAAAKIETTDQRIPDQSAETVGADPVPDTAATSGHDDLDIAREAVDQAFIALHDHKADRANPGDRETLTLFAAIAARRDPVDTARYADVDPDEANAILDAMHATGVWPAGAEAPAEWNERDPEPALRASLRRLSAARRAAEPPKPPLGRIMNLVERRILAKRGDASA